MLTEEQLAALLDALSGVDRLVLVGDPRQLPPIGSGRPFVDIVRELEPDDIEHRFPRIGRGYGKLTVPRRQRGTTRADLLLASWFGGNPDPAADEIWDRLNTEAMDEIRFESWTDEEDLQAKLLDLIVTELKLDGPDDEVGFECSLGATTYNGATFFWRSRDPEAPLKAEGWPNPVAGARRRTWRRHVEPCRPAEIPQDMAVPCDFALPQGPSAGRPSRNHIRRQGHQPQEQQRSGRVPGATVLRRQRRRRHRRGQLHRERSKRNCFRSWKSSSRPSPATTTISRSGSSPVKTGLPLSNLRTR